MERLPTRTRTRSPRRTKGVDAGEHPCVPGPQIEFGHGGDPRHVAAGIDIVAAEEENEVAIDAVQIGIAGMDDEAPHHAHCDLHHLVGMRVVHECPAPAQHELVDKGLAGIDVGLGQAADAIHAVG
jgi:hypothetical protein